MAEEKEKVKTKRPTALKRDIQSERRQLENRVLKARIGTAVRNFEKDSTQETLKALQALLDKCAKKGIFKLNKVSRLKAKYASKAV